MELSIYQVDAFTSQPFKGNPAGVCITQTALDDDLMLAIAAEMALPETAFLALDDFNLRWFTPTVEVKLCGHGTLAVAHILKQHYDVTQGQQLVFNTLSGELVVTINANSIDMNFPAAHIDSTFIPTPALLTHLGLTADQVLSSHFFNGKALIEIANEADLLALAPNFDGLNSVGGLSAVVVTSPSTTNTTDFISRHFGPWVGINEDPVTGAAHCGLAVFWGNKLNKTRLTGYQASSRGGEVKIELLGNHRVMLSGQAVTVLKGTMLI
ncbi:PhzF family phenazine biosynthesis protein [Photobacterium aquimaris]|uniref:PhzF family phenazine biosynthesis protein n=1 Tax=Photobacterium aquimaris TaxID=512643 RepID=A0A2T3HT71_9GAMM|nr:PhzF family phenazine biosynthesis protein [Photobacterium aquimaris]MCP4957621.1 PhzF family phenazine biosynthesis protein [Photobacterium aquimaris]OBU21186.1 phenazine biosynthesis protein PhzF [Photobacterium aquimaris]PQJ41189.1 phenazine biosynthesis protein PhzF [Photobacterium aquimaris]PST98013.1 PhzF family phenazine biosynthesis protein [Photobacterium aquimaris]